MLTTEDKLILIQEECAELIKACAKAQRFGLDNTSPVKRFSTLTNMERIRRECVDVLAVIDLFMSYEDNKNMIDNGVREKKRKIIHWNNAVTEIVEGRYNNGN